MNTRAANEDVVEDNDLGEERERNFYVLLS